MYDSHNLAIMIKARAKEKGIAIKDMLSELSLGSNTMSALYHGKSIAFDSLAKIADYLDCSVDYLLGRTDDANDSDITFNDFTYALHNETKDLTDEQKQSLLDMARIFKQALEKEDKRE